MPNWCYNRIRIDADSDQVEQLKEIHDIFENHSDPFNQILPIPDFKNIPNEKGELPKLKQHKNDKGEIMWETYDNLVDNVCNARTTYLSETVKGI